MNYYQHHIGDFIRDTARLSDSQCMAYLRMIWIYYETEESLEDDANAIAFRTGANASDVQQILRHFFFQHDGRWHHARCDREILAFREKSEKAKKSADARWKNANAMRTHSERKANEPVFDANQEPVTNISTTSVVEKGTSSARGSRLPADWQCPDDWIQDAIGIRPHWDRRRVLVTADNFRDYWIAQPGAKGRKTDWRATWRNWVRNEREQNNGQVRPITGRQSMVDNYAAQAAAARGETYGQQSSGSTERVIDGEATRVA